MATTTLASCNSRSLYRTLQRRERNDALRTSRPFGSIPLEPEFSLTAAQLASGEIVELIEFPAGFRLLNLVAEATDMDTGGSPAFVFDVIFVDADGVETVLINDATVGQGGGTVAMVSTAFLLDLSNGKIKFRSVTSPATAAAGTLTLRLQIQGEVVSSW